MHVKTCSHAAVEHDSRPGARLGVLVNFTTSDGFAAGTSSPAHDVP